MKTKLAISILSFAVLAVASFTKATPVSAAAGWITTCNYSHSLPDDPIVFDPLQHKSAAGQSHMHDFLANKTTNAMTTVQDLLSTDTTCFMKADKSAYWVPALYKDGNRVLPTGTMKHMLVYYRRGSINMATKIQPIPPGLKIIVGNAKATSPAENEGIRDKQIEFKCGPGSGTNMPNPPSQCSSGVMVISYTFPNCWDGRNLDSADHKSHMSYPKGGGCPSTHPVAIPRIKKYIRYGVGTGPIGTVTMASGEYYTAHADFFNGWDAAPLHALIDKCLNTNVDCGKNPAIPQ